MLKHKGARLNFAREHILWTDEQNRMLFLSFFFRQKKRFNLDGPNGQFSFLHGLRKHDALLSDDQTGVGSIISWAGTGSHGKIELVFIDTRLNSSGQVDLLREQLRLLAEQAYDIAFVFQQDNASVFKAKVATTQFHSNEIRLLSRPGCSPNLSIIENLWRALFDVIPEVVNNTKTFRSQKKELLQLNASQRNALGQNTIRNLQRSLPNQLVSVLENTRGTIAY